MKQFLKGLGKKLLAASIILGFLYGVIKMVTAIGVVYVISFLYLMLGFMVAWETRQSQGHKLWPLVIVFWLPMIVWGLSRRGLDFSEELADKMMEEKERRRG